MLHSLIKNSGIFWLQRALSRSTGTLQNCPGPWTRISPFFLFPIGLLLFFLHISTHELRADPAEKLDYPSLKRTGYYGGRFSAYYGNSGAFYYNGSVISDIQNANRDAIPLWNSVEDFLLVYYIMSKANRPDVQGKTGRAFSIQYGLNDSFALSLDVDDRTYVTRGIATNYMPYLLTMTVMRNTIASSQYYDVAHLLNMYYLGFKTNEDILRLVTLGGSLEYHPYSRQNFDPFFNAGVAWGREFMGYSAAYRMHAGVGVRYYFLNHFFLRSELSYQRYEIRRTNDGYGINRPPVDGNLDEGRIDLSVGFSLPEFHFSWQLKEDPKDLEEVVTELKKEREVELVLKDNRLTVILPNDAVFPSGSDEMVLNGKKTIARISAIFRRTHQIHFTVEGHTDNQPVKAGSPYRSNQELSEIRAEKIRQLMVENGILAERLHIRGYGDRQPRISNGTEADRAVNRRIEIVADEDVSKYPDLLPLITSGVDEDK